MLAREKSRPAVEALAAMLLPPSDPKCPLYIKKLYALLEYQAPFAEKGIDDSGRVQVAAGRALFDGCVRAAQAILGTAKLIEGRIEETPEGRVRPQVNVTVHRQGVAIESGGQRLKVDLADDQTIEGEFVHDRLSIVGIEKT